MKYLRKFETMSEVQEWQSGNEHVIPNVAFVKDSGDVLYNLTALRSVMIQHIDGSLYTTDAWRTNGFTNDQANGVAVLGANSKFVISKVEFGNCGWSSDTRNRIDGILTSDKTATAREDYAGATNTAIIADDDTSGAALACANYTFPNGQKGYLPAAGQWGIAWAYKAEITTAMQLIGGTVINSGYYWSSTQYSASYAWVMSWGGGGITYESKSSLYFTRPFCAL